MPIANVNGQDLYFDQRGRGEPLLLVMGMSGTHRQWGEPFLDALARDFAVTFYDHRGIATEARVEEQFTLADLADDAAGLLDALGIESAHVAGVSMGGMVAQELALRHPERIRTLVIGCSYAGGEGSGLTDPAAFRRLSEAWMSGDREQILRTGWEINVSPGFAQAPGEYEVFREAALAVRAPMAIIGMQLHAIGAFDASARLERITAPTLVVHGTEDQMLPVGNSRVIAAKVPGARLEELEGVGHLFWWEQPERTADLVREHARAAAAAG